MQSSHRVPSEEAQCCGVRAVAETVSVGFARLAFELGIEFSNPTSLPAPCENTQIISQFTAMAAVSLAVVDREDIPIYCIEFPTKYHWKESGPLDEELFGLEHLVKDGGMDENLLKDDFDCSLKQQFILHSALDRFVHLAGPPPGYNWRSPGALGIDANFVGLLCPIEDFRVYGYVSATKIKFVVVVEDDEMIALADQQVVDDRIKNLLVGSPDERIEHRKQFLNHPFAATGKDPYTLC